MVDGLSGSSNNEQYFVSNVPPSDVSEVEAGAVDSTAEIDNNTENKASIFAQRQKVSSQNNNYSSDGSRAGANDLQSYYYEQLDSAIDEQGIIGKPINAIKNLAGTVFKGINSPSNIEKAISELGNNPSDEELVAIQDKIDQYKKNQDTAVKTTATTGAMIAGGAVGAKVGAALGTALFPGVGTAIGIAAGAAVGALTSIVINQFENMTDKVKGNSWQNDENLKDEAKAGARSGALGAAFGFIEKAVSGFVGAKLGLTSVNVGEKTVMAKLAEDGSVQAGKTILGNTVAKGASGAVGSMAVADAEYLYEVATDKDKDFSLKDFGTTNLVSGTIGGAVGAISGAIEGKNAVNAANNQIKQKAEAAAAEKAQKAALKQQQAMARLREQGNELIMDNTPEQNAQLIKEEIQGHVVLVNGNSSPYPGFENQYGKSCDDILSGYIDAAKANGTEVGFLTSGTTTPNAVDERVSAVAAREKVTTSLTTEVKNLTYVGDVNDATITVAKNTKDYIATEVQAANSVLNISGGPQACNEYAAIISSGKPLPILVDTASPAPAIENGKVKNAAKLFEELYNSVKNGTETTAEYGDLTREFVAKNLDKIERNVKFIHFDSAIDGSARQAGTRAHNFTFSDGPVKAMNTLIDAAELGYRPAETVMQSAIDSGLYSTSKLAEIAKRLGIRR